MSKIGTSFLQQHDFHARRGNARLTSCCRQLHRRDGGDAAVGAYEPRPATRQSCSSFASGSADRAPIRGLRSGSGRLARILDRGKPTNSLCQFTSKRLKVYVRLLLGLLGDFVLVQDDFPPTQSSL